MCSSNCSRFPMPCRRSPAASPTSARRPTPMKFTLEWLQDHVDTDASVDEIAATLTTVGLEVEGVEQQGAALAAFVTAHIVSAEQHPNADKLRVCKVDAGTGELIDVVCVAPNARIGRKSDFAFLGLFILGNDMTIG